MLTGNLVRVRISKQRVIPLYIPRDDDGWLDVAEGLLLIFREGEGRTRGEITEEIDALVGEGLASLVHRGMAKVLEDRAEFEVVSEVPPEELRRRVFTAAAEHRQSQRKIGAIRAPFRRDEVLKKVARDLAIEVDLIVAGLFADLKDENRLLTFADLSAQRLLDRYNVALAQAVLLRSVRMTVEVRDEPPARYRQLFRWLKFNRLLWRVEGTMRDGYTLQIDGPLSLFSSTNKYGLQMAMFLPALLHCRNFRLDAELRWGKNRDPRSFHLESAEGLISHHDDQGTYIPPEVAAFAERFRQVAPTWELRAMTDVIELGRDGVWVPDFQIVHAATGTVVYLDILGFWRKSSLERLIDLLTLHGPPRILLALSEKFKVDDEALARLPGPVVKFREIPNASEIAERLEQFLGGFSLS